MSSRLSSANFRSTPALLLFLLTAAIGVALDLYTKKVAFEKLAPWGVEDIGGRIFVKNGPLPEGEPPPVHRFIPGFVNFMAMANQGAVFGIGQGQRTLFITVSVAAIAFIIYLFATSGRQRFYQFILGLLLAGVLGNMYDRLTLGYVRDMIYIFPGRHFWGTNTKVFPWIFNVADSLLCVGVALIFLYSLRAPSEEHAPRHDDRDADPLPAADARGS